MASENLSVLDYEWTCPSCTYINKAGSFKCFMCATPKGTSTRQVKFSFSSIEQQYVAESLQTMSRQHATKSSSCLGKRRIRGKCGQSSSTHRTYMEVSCESFDLDTCILERDSQATMKKAGRKLNDGHTVENSSTCRHICKYSMEHEVSADFRKKGKTEKQSQRTADVQELYTTEVPPAFRSQLLLWPKLSNIDRSSKKCHVISVNSVSVVIKEYQALYADSD